MNKVMETCANVAEALMLISRYNLSHMSPYQTFIADQTGDAAIIEGDAVIHKNGSNSR